MYLRFLIVICAVMVSCSHAWAGEITLEGKVIATVVRGASVPFPCIIDKVLVQVGDTVSRGQRLVQYHLQAGERRAFQHELLFGGNTEDLLLQQAGLENEQLHNSTQLMRARQLAESGLGEKKDVARAGQIAANIQRRRQLVAQKLEKNARSFSLRAKELSEYFGVPVKAGSTLPEQMYLTAPIDGVVLDIASWAQTDTLAGGGAAPVSIGQINPMLLQVQVYESEIEKIQVGAAATIDVPSLSGKTFRGSVRRVTWNAIDLNIAAPSFYFVYLDIENPALELKPGFKVLAHIQSN